MDLIYYIIVFLVLAAFLLKIHDTFKWHLGDNYLGRTFTPIFLSTIILYF